MSGVARFKRYGTRRLTTPHREDGVVIQSRQCLIRVEKATLIDGEWPFSSGSLVQSFYQRAFYANRTRQNGINSSVPFTWRKVPRTVVSIFML